jgi:hypothetical protein
MANKLIRGTGPVPVEEEKALREAPINIPTWRYGPKGQAVLCNTAAELDEAEKAGFKDTPAAFPKVFKPK